MVKINSGIIKNLEFLPVTVEVSVTRGFPDYRITGLAGKQIKESEDRIKNAFLSCGFKFPRQKIFINLNPNNIDKDDSELDLPIALGILSATKQINLHYSSNKFYIGQLDFQGRVSTDIKKFAAFLRWCIDQKNPFSFVGKLHSLPNLLESITPQIYLELNSINKVSGLKQSKSEHASLSNSLSLESLDIKTTLNLTKTEVELILLSIVTREHTLLIGPPGKGKTEIAKLIARLQRYIDTKDYLLQLTLGQTPPTIIEPLQEISLSKFIGITTQTSGSTLILNELPEFDRDILSNLKSIIDQKSVRLHNKTKHIELPANPHIIATANPCKCGYTGSTIEECLCKEYDIHRYFRNITGGLLDRFTLNYFVGDGETRSKVRAIDLIKTLDSFYKQSDLAVDLRKENLLLAQIASQFLFSDRKLQKIPKLARSLAKLEGLINVKKEHYYKAAYYCDDTIFRKLLKK